MAVSPQSIVRASYLGSDDRCVDCYRISEAIREGVEDEGNASQSGPGSQTGIGQGAPCSRVWARGESLVNMYWKQRETCSVAGDQEAFTEGVCIALRAMYIHRFWRAVLRCDRQCRRRLG